MKTLRVILRAALFAVATTILFLAWVAGKYLLAPMRPARQRWRRIILNTWARTLALIIGMRITVKGEPPRPPFFLVSNHLSYIDIIAYAAHLDCVFVAKHDIAGWPGFGLLARGIGTIFINREKLQDIPRVIGLIDGALAEGAGIVLFPEGTSTMGDTVRRFSAALLEPAARAGYPVSYAAITYRTPPDEPPAHMAVCWWGEMTFAPHLLELLKVRRFEAEIRFGAHAIAADDRRVLAASLWESVNRMFVPVVEPQSLDRNN